MKSLQLNTTTIVVLLLFMISIFGFDNTQNAKELEVDKIKSEGFVAFIVNEKTVDTEGGDVQNECECNGTKELTHGDGHKTPCPCVGTESGCKCKLNSQTFTELGGQKQILFFTASWCPPCSQFKSYEIPKLKKSKWVVSEKENSQIRMVDVDKNPSLYAEYSNKTGKKSIPLFVKTRGDSIIDTKSGFQTASTIANWFNN